MNAYSDKNVFTVNKHTLNFLYSYFSFELDFNAFGNDSANVNSEWTKDVYFYHNNTALWKKYLYKNSFYIKTYRD